MRRAFGRSYANPLTHVCASRPGDFKRRKAAADKRTKALAAAEARRSRAAARPASQKQDHTRRRDKDCERAACEAFRTGREEGFEDGYKEGYAAGIEAGRRPDR